MFTGLIGNTIYSELSKVYSIELEDFVAPRLNEVPLFEFIVAVMLSQNTSDENAWRAYSNLKSALREVKPELVASASTEYIASLIKPAGMHYQRASRLRKLAEIFLSYDVEGALLGYIKAELFDEARRFLTKLPGVGEKTADIVLLMKYGVPTFPVDTHITRITLRMGFVSKKNYEVIRAFWMKNTSPEYYKPLHLLLITHGRQTCKARKPNCTTCVIKKYCKYA